MSNFKIITTHWKLLHKRKIRQSLKEGINDLITTINTNSKEVTEVIKDVTRLQSETVSTILQGLKIMLVAQMGKVD